MPSQRTLSSRWHDVFSARVKHWLARKVLPRPILCRRRGVCVCAQKKTKRAMQGERKPCKGAKGVRGQLEGGCLRVSAATVRVSLGFPGVS